MEKKTGKLKILYVSANGYLGGAERVVLTAAQEHIKGGRVKPIILFFKNGEAITEAKNSGIECKVLKSEFRLSRPYELLRALNEIRKYVREESPSLVHNTMAYAQLVTSLATLGMGVRKVWFQHGPVGGLLDKLASLFSVEMMFYNGHFLKRLHHLSFPHSSIRKGEAIIRPGVKSDRTQREILQKDLVIIGSAGRICKGKSFDKIISSLAHLDLPFQLLIAGEAKSEHDRFYLEELLEQSGKLGLEKKVIFLGHQEDMEGFYHRIDVFIHASETPEPFGLVIAEAMAHGCLTIASNSGGAADFLIHGQTGLTYSSFDELGRLVASILNCPSDKKYSLIAHQGQALIQKDYSTSQMGQCLEDIYETLLS